MSIIELYKYLLDFCGISTSEGGLCYKAQRSGRMNVTVNNKPLYLPLPEVLRDVTDKVIFHPLTETSFTSESKVCQMLTKAINVRINMSATIIAQALLALAASSEMHKQLTPSQTELILALGDVDATTVSNLVAVINKSLEKEASYKLIVNLYLKQGGVLNDVKYRRSAIISFPFMDNIEQEDYKNIKFRSKDKAVYEKLFRFMFPNMEVENSYSFGSNSIRAPYIHALFFGAVRVASEINNLANEFKDYIREDDLAMCLYNTEWYNSLEDLDKLAPLIQKIPAQSDNEGNVIKTEPLHGLSMKDLGVAVQTPPAIARPMAQPVVAQRSGGLTMADLDGPNHVPQYNPRLYQQPYAAPMGHQNYNQGYNGSCDPRFSGGMTSTINSSSVRGNL